MMDLITNKDIKELMPMIQTIYSNHCSNLKQKYKNKDRCKDKNIR